MEIINTEAGRIEIVAKADGTYDVTEVCEITGRRAGYKITAAEYAEDFRNADESEWNEAY